LNSDGARSFEIVVAGHIVIDEIIDKIGQVTPRRALGGAPSYSSIALSSLGYNPEIITHIGEDFPLDFFRLLEEKTRIDIRKWVSPGFMTTSYRIDRSGEHRRLWLTAKCRELTFDDFKPFITETTSTKALVLNPVAGEISLSLLERVSKEFDHVFIDSQGFVRRFDKRTGEVGMRSGLDISALAGVDFMKADLEELSAWTGTSSKESAIRQLSRFVGIILLTSGPGAVELYESGESKLKAVPFKVQASDTTGAGDIMLSSFAARYNERGDIKDALSFAVAASTLSVRNYGVEKAILSKTDVEKQSKMVEIVS
jgi:sugar/nucleoside kinase (ribokinase family)